MVAGSPRRVPLSRPHAKVLAWAVGLVLTALAVWLAARQIDLSALRQAEPRYLAAIGAAVLANLVLSACLIWLITLSFDLSRRVPLALMIQLIAASHLLNYLPLRAGLLGRAAYLKYHHGLSWGGSLRIMVVVATLTGITLGAMIALTVAGTGLTGTQRLIVALMAMVLASIAMPWLGRFLLGTPAAFAWTWLAVRVADLAVTGLRLWAAFAIIDMPISPGEAILLAAVRSAVGLIGVTPNGLGISEWAIAAVTALLSPGMVAAGAAAAVIDRVVELLVTLVTGLASMAALPMRAWSKA